MVLSTMPSIWCAKSSTGSQLPLSIRLTPGAWKAKKRAHSKFAINLAEPHLIGTVCQSATQAISRHTGWATKQYKQGLPRILGGQAAGSAPIVLGKVVDKPETIATAIRIGNPARWRQALEALDESGGIITAVTDEKILESWSMLAKLEGVFVEPASATGLAALKQQIEQGEIDPRGKTAVCILTGHGLKDPGTAIDQAAPPMTLPAEIDALEAYLAS